MLAPQNGAQATKYLQLPSHTPPKQFATLQRGLHIKNLSKTGHAISEIAGHDIFEMTGHTSEINGHDRVKYAEWLT